MKTYLVGGYVRDRLLQKAGFPISPSDRDWVVVGASPEDMVDAGYLPVGKDFPVFLHPETHEEFALARTERKIGMGYHGFSFYTSPNITLEEDLRRRDLTINAMAEDESGRIIDPYGGQKDLTSHVLRHVSEAFAEDPVRILRVARFAARFPTFTVAPETMCLMKKMVQNGEADALVKERIWAELEKGFQELAPHRLISVMTKCGLWKKLFPLLSMAESNFLALEKKEVFARLPLSERIALLTRNCSTQEEVQASLERVKTPKVIVHFAMTFWLIAHYPVNVNDATNLATLYLQTDALRKPERFISAIRLMTFLTGNSIWGAIENYFPAWRDIDFARIQEASVNASGGAMGKVIRAIRLEQLHRAINQA